MDEIKKFFECLLPVTACNLRCNYCYVIQRNQRKEDIPKLKYSPELIGKALTKERLGGVCYFSICGAGETLIPKDIVDITFNLLKQGHYVNLTTNGTITNRFDEIINLPKESLKRLNFSFSLHYNELIRLKLLDTFFRNVRRMKEAGCSVMVQINLTDEYVPNLEEIRKICIERVGAPPQVAATRKEKSITSGIELLTLSSEKEYTNQAERFKSPLFDFTMKNFNVKRKEFCYAGDWTYVLNLQTGILKRCYSSYIFQNVFKDIEKPIMELAVGNNCRSAFCFNSSHFMALGVIPSIETPTYEALRNRTESNWYSEEMKSFLSQKLYNNNLEYSKMKKILSNVIGKFDLVIGKVWQIYSELRKKK